MSTPATISEVVDRVSRHDFTLEMIYSYNQQLTDAEVAELVDCLLAHPDVVKYVWLGGNQLTDETGIKLARYISISSTIEWMNLCNNQFGLATYLALAAALHVNTSLQNLSLLNNQGVNRNRTDVAFADALILNPNRPFKSSWHLYSGNQNEFERLKKKAEELGHPSMQAMLAAKLIRVT